MCHRCFCYKQIVKLNPTCRMSLQDGVYREMWSSDTALQWKIPENPTRHSRWVSPLLLHITLTSPLPFLFFGWGRHHFAIRNCLSNSLMVIPHLRSAGQLDRLRTLLFLTSEANCRGSGSIADGSVGLFLARSVTSSLRVTVSLPGGAQAAGWNFSGRRKPS